MMNVSCFGRLALISLACLSWGCSGDVSGDLGSGIPPLELGTVSVQSVYSTNYNWMDYVKNNNGGTSLFDQPDVACDGSETGGYSACIHGGEKRKIVLNGYSSCSNISAEDALGAFDWTCVVDAGVATVYMNGLKSGKGLLDLMDGSGWLANSVTLYYLSTEIGSSASSVWWTNPIVDAPDNSASAAIALDGTDDGGNDDVYTEGTIFRVTATRLSSGYNLNLDKLAFVVFPGASLDYCESGTLACKFSTGELSLVEKCMLSSGSQNFLWVEGTVDGKSGTPADFGLVLVNSKFSRVNNFTYLNGDDTGLGLHDSSNNKFTGLRISNPGSFSNIYSDNSDYNLFYDVVGANSANEGLYFFNGSDNNTLVHVKMMNNDPEPIHFNASVDNTLVDVITSNSNNASLHIINNSHRTTVSHYSSFNDDDESIFLNSLDATINQYLVANSGTSFGSFLFDSADNVIMSQTAAANAHDDGYELTNVDNGHFTNNILVGSIAFNECSVTGGTNPGLTSACAMQGTSDGNMVTGKDFSSSFLAKVTSDDSSNSSDTNGSAAFSDALDWLNFDNWFRAWGQDGSAFPNADNTMACLSGTCRIWDWRLSSSDTQILNRSGDGVNANSAFIANSNCPSAIHGNVALTDQNSSPRTFLVNAVEISGDYVGNDNGLCENYEACIYSPNFGAYQGEGDYSSNGTCNFQDGTVNGVTMYAYPTNGA